MRSTSCSRTALARYCGIESRSACSRAGPMPMRASSTRRGALPLRNPGSRTSRAMLRNAWSMSRSNSASSTSTYSLTLFPSRVSSELFTERSEGIGRRPPRRASLAGGLHARRPERASVVTAGYRDAWRVVAAAAPRGLGRRARRTRLQDRCRGLGVTPIDELRRRSGPRRRRGQAGHHRPAQRRAEPRGDDQRRHRARSPPCSPVAARIPGIEHGRAIVLEGVAVDRATAR